MSDASTPNTPTAPADAAAAKDADQRAQALVLKRLSQSATDTPGSVRLADGRVLGYRCRTEFLAATAPGLMAASSEPQAAVFTVAYLADPSPAVDGSPAPPRPVCFAFNGGPGSASVWLHLGALGPKRVRIGDDGSMPPPPYAVQDNPLTWLEHFDLVFVDPPHTGFSVSAGEAARKKLLSVDGDVQALAEVVRAWLARHRRYASPLYLAGESYGTTRGAALADRLQTAGIALTGVILVSCAMDLQTLDFHPRNDLPHALFLPAFAHVAHYHGLLKGTLAASAEAARAAAEDFVQTRYLGALHAGARLDARERRRTARRLAELTGLPPDLVESKNLRIDDETFFFEALRHRGLQVGRLEARVTGPMAARRTRTWEFDPGMEALNAPYTMATMDYFASLGLPELQHYEVFSAAVHQAWDWHRDKEKGHGFVTTSDDLARALRRNPHLRVFVASGRCDLGTPYSASDWALAQLDAPSEVLARVTHRHYDAGHMMYTRQGDLQQLKDDLAAWLVA